MQVIAKKCPLAVSVGEPAGIGLDVLLDAWQQRLNGANIPDLFVICDPDHLRDRVQSLGMGIEIEEITADQTLPAMANRLPVMRLENQLHGKPAEPHAEDAAGIVEAITTAVDMVKLGVAGGVVTLPINKKSLYDAGFSHPGHTEFLGALAEHWPDVQSPVTPVMMLAGPELKAVPVTIHIPLKDVAENLTSNLIVETVATVHSDLRRRFGITDPRIAISGLNPHAGENGAMGREDIDVILPAIAELQELGISCIGPLPADTMFHAAARASYDAAVCMYHDQALIPAKALAFDETVNVTLGLPFVRTSPDHGTAFDIAGTGKANPASLVAAMRMAASMADRASK